MADSLALFGILNGCRCFVSFLFLLLTNSVGGFCNNNGAQQQINLWPNECMRCQWIPVWMPLWMPVEWWVSVKTRQLKSMRVCVCVGRNDNRRICCYIMNGLVWRQQVTALFPLSPFRPPTRRPCTAPFIRKCSESRKRDDKTVQSSEQLDKKPFSCILHSLDSWVPIHSTHSDPGQITYGCTIPCHFIIIIDSIRLDYFHGACVIDM